MSTGIVTGLRRQQGVSLIEIMIGMLLSLILVAGVVQVYISNKQTYYLQDELSRLQENGRFAVDILQRVIRGAGFDNDLAFNAANTIDAGNGASDQLEVIQSGRFDCVGTQLSVAPNPPIAVNDLFFIDANNNLACLGSGNPNPQPLVENVDQMQVLYGVDTDGNRTADRYINATAVNGAGLWTNVVSVRIGLLLSTSTREERSRMVQQAQNFGTVANSPMLAVFDINNDGTPDLFDTDGDGIPDSSVAQDNRLYRVYTTTIALRNRVP